MLYKHIPEAGEILFNELGKLIEFDKDKLSDNECASLRGDALADPPALVPKLFTLLLWWIEFAVGDDIDKRCNGEINASSIASSNTADRCKRWWVEAWIIRGALRRRLVDFEVLEERKFKCEFPCCLLSTCIVLCLIIERVVNRGDAEHERIVFGGNLFDDIIDGGVKGGIITILLRDSDVEYSSSDVIDVNIRRRKEVNLAI